MGNEQAKSASGGPAQAATRLIKSVFLRRIVLMALPFLTAAAPVAFYNGRDWLTDLAAVLPKVQQEEPRVEIPTSKPAPPAPAPSFDPHAPIEASLEGPRFHDLGEVLNFAVTTDWIVTHWPRVSANLAQLELRGYRVPLVTGTAEDDLAGALTYYFNPRQQVQRITFNGTTGNANRLIRLLSSRYGFVHRPTNDPGLFLYVVPDGGREVKSFLWIRPVPVVSANQPHRRFEVALVMERPERP